MLSIAPNVKKQIAYGLTSGWTAHTPVRYIGTRISASHHPSLFTPIYNIGVTIDTIIRSLKNHKGIFAGAINVARLISCNFSAIRRFHTIYGISRVFTRLFSFCQYTSFVNFSTLAKYRYPDITKNAGTATLTSV